MPVSQSGARSDVRITAYNADLAFVTERRHLPVTAGITKTELTDIPAKIDPTSVHLTPGKTQVRLVEQSFQYDLAAPDRVLERYLGHPIEAVLKNGDLKSGELLSWDDRMMVLRSGDGGVGLVLRSEIVDARMPSLPEGLRTLPTLVWQIESTDGGNADVELSYLTAGMKWHAEYVAVLDQDDAQVELAAWVSLENRCGAAFDQARLQLMAGDVHRVQRAHVREDMDEEVEDVSLVVLAPRFREEALFEYHLYSFDRIVTIADRETKQLELFPPVVTPAQKTFIYEGGRRGREVRVEMEIENREERGLGIPLPAGTLRTYKRDSSGNLHFVGEDEMPHTPRHETIHAVAGTAFDVIGERKVAGSKRVSGHVQVEEVEVTIRNRKKEPIEVLVRETLWPSWRIMKSTHEHIVLSASSVEFKLQVAADAVEVLAFSYRYGM